MSTKKAGRNAPTGRPRIHPDGSVVCGYSLTSDDAGIVERWADVLGLSRSAAMRAIIRAAGRPRRAKAVAP